MTGAPSTDRLFSLSCFEGLRLIRQYSRQHPALSPLEVVDLVLSVEADAMSLDMEAAIHLNENVAVDCPLDGEPFYQGCIKAVVVTHQPIWARSMRQGRMRFIHSLVDNPKHRDDDLDVFSAAGLMRNPPSEQVVAWWDDILSHARLAIDIEKMAQARKAESLTIERERQRLAELGIERLPEWKGLDDNYAGYDVLSFDMKDGAEINIMIEVKSTVASPLRFYLSRNEWKTADAIGEAYKFHIWNMATDPPQLYERTVEQVRPHIPSDNEKGKWSNADIPLGT